MNLTGNKRLVARFFELLNAGAHDEAVSLFTNDFVWSMPESIPGGGEKSAAELRELMTGIVSLFDGRPQFTVVSMTAESDRVSAELLGVGDLKNGNHYRNRYHMLFFLSGTSIRRVNEYVDTHYSIENIFGG
jgi:ketosteroid isomerase-like protein